MRDFHFLPFSECFKHQDAFYNNRSYGCYSFTNKRKSHKDATTYCLSMSPRSHLVFVDSAEKVRDLKDVLRKYPYRVSYMFLKDNIYVTESLFTMPSCMYLADHYSYK